MVSFFKNGSTLFEESGVGDEGAYSHQERKNCFNLQYNESYLKYGFRSTLSALSNLQLQVMKQGNEAFKTTLAHED